MTEHKKLFNEIDNHIQNDLMPSHYLRSIDSMIFDNKHPFTMLSRLKDVKQSPQHHPEGSVWNHTLLVLDEAAARKDQASDRRVFLWAALLHDIGKAVTTKVRKGKITAYDHDKAGALLATAFLREFECADFTSRVSALVRWHMQILYVAKSMPFADLDTMRRETDVRDVALLGLCDRLGRKGINRHAEEETIHAFLRKVTESTK